MAGRRRGLVGSRVSSGLERLRRITSHELRANRNHETLQPTALVNDLFVRLLGADKLDITNRRHL